MQDADEGLALEACEFWSACCEVAADAATLRPVLPKLIPVLLGNMVYKEDDEEVLEAQAGEAESSDAEDRDQELKPFIQRWARLPPAVSCTCCLPLLPFAIHVPC